MAQHTESNKFCRASDRGSASGSWLPVSTTGFLCQMRERRLSQCDPAGAGGKGQREAACGCLPYPACEPHLNPASISDSAEAV